MVSTFTQNIQLQEPARGDQVGTWDTSQNPDFSVLDLVCGGQLSIAVTGANIVLSSAQYTSALITFTSTLVNNITVTFASTFTKTYDIQNLCTASTAFTITLTTTAASQSVCVPPGEVVGVVVNSSVILFATLDRIGSYREFPGTAVPVWISGCTVPPYLNCNGATFSSATYPQLATQIGSTTLPDSRGRSRFALAQGTGRISAAGAGVDGTVLNAAGGSEFTQSHNHAVSDPTHGHGHNAQAQNNAGQWLATSGAAVNATATINSAATGISVNNFGGGASQNIPPALVTGITMIRAG